jgi:hypothetical protein
MSFDDYKSNIFGLTKNKSSVNNSEKIYTGSRANQKLLFTNMKYCSWITDCSDLNQKCVDFECRCRANYKYNPGSRKCEYFKCSNSYECQTYDSNRYCNSGKCECLRNLTEDIFNGDKCCNSSTFIFLSNKYENKYGLNSNDDKENNQIITTEYTYEYDYSRFYLWLLIIFPIKVLYIAYRCGLCKRDRSEQRDDLQPIFDSRVRTELPGRVIAVDPSGTATIL